MKPRIHLLICALTLSLTTESRADIVVPGADGADLALTITANTVIDLSQAITGNWNDAVAPGNEGKGIYDPVKWAIVFRYSAINIAVGTTVTFKNHPSRAPVIWLVSGPCSVDGIVNLSGQSFQLAPNLAEPGPGGFRGATGSYSSGVRASAGFGPGGGSQQSDAGGAGGYGTDGGGSAIRGLKYGNPSLVPLIGGSGGSGDPQLANQGGGAGGGAMLIAATGPVSVTGQIMSNGGNGFGAIQSGVSRDTGGGSAGGIRIVCDSLAGSGNLHALGGGGWATGGEGRIRLERVSVAGGSNLQVIPGPSVVDLQAGATALIFPPANAPTVKIVSIGGDLIGDDPRAEFGATGADAVVPETATTQAVIETTNVEPASQLLVRITPRSDGNATVVTAVRDDSINVDPLRWTAQLPVNVGYSAVQVRVVRP